MTLAMDHTHRYKKEYDPSTGDFYYFNEKTGETQWRKPGEGSALLLKVKESPGQDDDLCPTRSVSPEVNEEGGGGRCGLLKAKGSHGRDDDACVPSRERSPSHLGRNE